MASSNFSMIKNAMQEASETFAEVVTSVAVESQNQVEQCSAAGRSVLDYDHPHDLKLALEERIISAGQVCAEPPDGASDWLLPIPDPEAESQTVLTEMQRLLTLKSYLLLDAAKEEAFDTLTREACQVYNVPTSLISLVDLGRQFFLSNTGIPDETVRETPRTAAFCSHTILSKQGICVVPDTIQDARFRNSSLVTGGPKLRFYAGAPLVSPEGYKLGTFCIEGPDPRPQGLSNEEQSKLKEFAAKAMKLMVDRRSVILRAHASTNLPQNIHIRRHAAVTTNLGAIIYQHYFDESVTAMKFFQESVRAVMYLEDEPTTTSAPNPPTELFLSKDRQEELYTLLECMKAAESREQMDLLLEKVHLQFPITDNSSPNAPIIHADHIPRENSVPGIFTLSSVLHQGGVNPTQVRMQRLSFNEAFEVSLVVAEAFDPSIPSQSNQLDHVSFIIPLNQCSKATLFNMGLVHYQWGSADIAMQYFDLAASLSQTNDPTHFDPVILACLNNIAQVNLQYGRSTEAMELLSDALTRGNAALTKIYGQGSDDISVSSNEDVDTHMNYPTEERSDSDRLRTLRLRRKLARTLLNIAHVHFYKCEYDTTMATLVDTLKLLHTDMAVIEVASIWYNMALVQYYTGDKAGALSNIEKFLELTQRILCNSTKHIQIADALHRKGKILFELDTPMNDSMAHLNEALKLRRELLGEADPAVAESLCMIGKVLLHRKENEKALQAFQMGLAVQRETLATKTIHGEAAKRDDQLLSFEVAQTLLEIGRVYHAQNDLQNALSSYLEVLDLTRNFFGKHHAFVGRIDTIVGNLYSDLGDAEKSKRHLDEANDIQQQQQQGVVTADGNNNIASSA